MRTLAPRYIIALDQGTTSSRCILFGEDGTPICSHQREHSQKYPQPGWVEHDPIEIWNCTKDILVRTLKDGKVRAGQVAAIGITNQRETTVVWNPKTGLPYGNAIVWQDTRTANIVAALAQSDTANCYSEKTGLLLSTYFSGPKLKWMLDNVLGLFDAVRNKEAKFGTIDSWLIWWLTGGPQRGRHVTDVTNASRTLMMNIRTLQWDDEMLHSLGIPKTVLPEILPSIPKEPYGFTPEDGPLGVRLPVAAAMGDQQAALFGQTCFAPGMSKNTYGTGCFLLLNTGQEIVRSRHGLITTIAYGAADLPPVYALEGSIAIAGSLIQWLRDNLSLIEKSSEAEVLARRVEDSGSVYFVPAFSGLFAPYWNTQARGLLVGLTGHTNRGHIARAALEATAFQTRDIFEAMKQDSGATIAFLKVDGGMVVNEWLMQFQADLLGIPIIRSKIIETTALGAAYAAGLSVGFWENQTQLISLWQEDKRWNPRLDPVERDRKYYFWKKAVHRSCDWLE